MLTRHVRSLLRRALPQRLQELVDDFRYRGLPVPFRTVRPHAMTPPLQLYFLQELARRADAQQVAGDFVECGVFRGGSAGVLGYAAAHSPLPRRLWLYDAFAGMPAASAQDDAHAHTIQGQFVGSETQARRILQRLGVLEEQYRIVVGWFEDTLPRAEKYPIALLHVDCDFYDPVKLTLETFYDRVQPHGYVVLNDYGCFQGCRRAADAFLAGAGADIPLIQIDQDAYYFRKPAGASNGQAGAVSMG